MAVCALSTSDNPYNPFKDFDLWYAFDVQNGYNSCAYLARQIDELPVFSEEDESKQVEEAIDRIVALNLTGNYIKVTAD
jgi:hypothetical protein